MSEADVITTMPIIIQTCGENILIENKINKATMQAAVMSVDKFLKLFIVLASICCEKKEFFNFFLYFLRQLNKVNQLNSVNKVV